MKDSKLKYIDILVVSLTFHVFTVHTNLLYRLNELGEPGDKFTIRDFSLDTVFVIAIALSYSLATISVIRISRFKGLIWIYAILDSFGVLLKYWTVYSQNLLAVYFCIYTGVMIISTLYLSNPKYLIDDILNKLSKGISQKEIAKDLSLSESKVSRIIKQHKDQRAA